MSNLLIGIIFAVALFVVVYLFAYAEPEADEEKSAARQRMREEGGVPVLQGPTPSLPGRTALPLWERTAAKVEASSETETSIG